MLGQQNADIADTLQLRDVAVATIFCFLYMGAHWLQLVNTTEPSVCGVDAAFFQITLTTCYYTAQRPVHLYRSTKGGRLSRPRHCGKGVQPVPKTEYRCGCRDK